MGTITWEIPPSLKEHMKKHPVPFVVLFDIDGTLLKAGGLHQRAFHFASEHVFHTKKQWSWNEFQGRTDPWIMLYLGGKNPEENLVHDKTLSQALEVMTQWYRDHMDEESGTLLPGVKELLEEIDKRGYLRGLVTGNVEEIAYYKLKFFKIERGFYGGGFGSDHIDRSTLLRIALRKAEENYNYKWNGKNAIYIADTPRDVHAAHQAGLPCVVVKTGDLPSPDYTKEKPDLFLKDLTEKDLLFDYIDSLLESSS